MGVRADMIGRVLLYGASGFSGAPIAGRLADLGDRLVLAGRSADRLGPVARRLDLPMRVFDLAQPEVIDRALAGVAVVLNAAGPYRETAGPMVEACLRAGVDYVDLSGEWPVFAAAMAQDEAARAADVMLLPGAGVATAVTDGLLALAAEALPGAVRLRLGISAPHQLSRGSFATMMSLLDRHVLVRREGRLERLPAGRLAHDFDFGEGRRRCVGFSWPDVVTGEFTTGVPNIEAYCETTWLGRTAYRAAAAAAPLAREAGRRASAIWPDRPAPRTLDAAGYTIVAQAEDRWRRSVSVRLRTADGYRTTTDTAEAVVRRVLAGRRAAGFQTPARLFGSRFALQFGEATYGGTPGRETSPWADRAPAAPAGRIAT